ARRARHAGRSWRPPMSRTVTFALVLAGAALAVACSPDTTLEVANTGTSRPPPPTMAPDAGDVDEAPPIGKLDLTENDFVESDRNRDPFRSYATIFAPEPDRRTSQNQRAVLLN